MPVNWTIKRFDELTPFELYDLLRLRSEVFVVEQDCVFLDMDDKDQLCTHLMGWKNGRLIAYTRLVPAGISYDEPSIGRVVSSPAERGTGIGRLLMEESIRQVHLLFGPQPVRIGAQLYLKKFYESFGFGQVSEIYDEDGIDHILMLRS
ncbi:MAG: GNAT family N-acetyltransferase [Chitinophagaceae bacterium]|nr:MAG: GNAT family N-acetyltransferase [Chitinophagaceae bacterium]